MTGAASLRAAAARRGVLSGCMVEVEALSSDAEYAQLVVEQCNLLMPERAWRWEHLRPGSETYAFDSADSAVRFAEAHRVKLRGRTLVEAASMPAWFRSLANKDNARGLLAEHIDQVVGRYSGRMHSWDVAEAVVDGNSTRADGLRMNVWMELIGSDYLEFALRLARRADPQALLSLTQSELTGRGQQAHATRLATLLLLRRMRARNVPLDALAIPFAHGADMDEAFLLFLREMKMLDVQAFLMNVEEADAGAGRRRPESQPSGGGEGLKRMLATNAVKVIFPPSLCAKYSGWEDSGASSLFDRDRRPTEAFFTLRNALAL